MRPIVGLLLLLPIVSQAQLRSVTPGARVRVVVPALIPEPFYATFVTATADSVWLQEASGRTELGIYRAPRLALRSTQIVSMELRIPGNQSRSAFAGMLVGAGASVVIALANKSGSGGGGVNMAPLGVVLITGGGLIGARVGSESWKRVHPAP